MLEIDFTKIDHIDETFDQCDTKIAEAITYLKKSIIPILSDYTEAAKENQIIQTEEIISFSAELVHLLKTVSNLDINKGTSPYYHSEEQTTRESDCQQV